MTYLLDTNTCIDLIRNRDKNLIEHLTACQPGDVGVSSITVAELAYGARKSSRVEQNLAALEQFLLPLEVFEFDLYAALAYGNVRAVLEKQGRIIGSADMFIGAHALSLEATLVTNNTREFSRLDNLRLEDWTTK